ncbi:hypothetical protein EVAR_35394_1 [Eumeta japonica]|uniref:Uncharacterized protein n=1 Tax=Eumeta variegata TaxID=151549 RepID=A0A4C1XAM7_EUMVA|nr:hypothetical protein EVAR_35394_1 [Eumeta japonica]
MGYLDSAWLAFASSADADCPKNIRTTSSTNVSTYTMRSSNSQSRVQDEIPKGWTGYWTLYTTFRNRLAKLAFIVPNHDFPVSNVTLYRVGLPGICARSNIQGGSSIPGCAMKSYCLTYSLDIKFH